MRVRVRVLCVRVCVSRPVQIECAIVASSRNKMVLLYTNVISMGVHAIDPNQALN